MPSNEGRIATDDGEYTDATAAGRLYQWFRERTGTWFTGQQMDYDHYSEHRCRAASTRKSGINQQVDPNVEWIEHDRREGKEWYRHVFTHGQPPPDSATRMALIKTGEGYPVRGKGVVVPSSRRGRKARKTKSETKPAPPATKTLRVVSGQPGLFGSSHPVKPD